MSDRFDFDCPVKETEYLIEGMIPYNSISFIIGRPGFGKSFFSEQMAISVLTGQDFMGHGVKPETRQETVASSSKARKLA
jgi:KaiC/GvpD/RAD55 family RecA-like ATPase